MRRDLRLFIANDPRSVLIAYSKKGERYIRLSICALAWQGRPYLISGSHAETHGAQHINRPPPSGLVHPPLPNKSLFFIWSFLCISRSVMSSTQKASLDLLDDERNRTARQAIANVLNTELAEFTYAQILDGLPTQQSLLDSCNWMYDHPVITLKHVDLCDGFLEKARKFRSQFDPSTLEFDKNVSRFCMVTQALDSREGSPARQYSWFLGACCFPERPPRL